MSFIINGRVKGGARWQQTYQVLGNVRLIRTTKTILLSLHSLIIHLLNVLYIHILLPIEGKAIIVPKCVI